MHISGHIHVISCGIEQSFNQEALQHIAHAHAIFASKALLSLCPPHTKSPTQQRFCITAKAQEEAKHALTLCNEGKRVVVLASGDALYHGIGATLLRLRQEQAITFHPHITAFQALFHKLALPWSGASLFSVHAEEHIPVRRITHEPFSVIYGGTQHPASTIAKALMDFHPPMGESLAVLAQCLGTPHEQIQVATLKVLAHIPCHATSILLMLPPNHYAHVQNTLKAQAVAPAGPADTTTPLDSVAPTSPAGPLLPLGLPEQYYTREKNLITASDVRAIVLARLRLPAWGTMWDIGAGSGSVGLEAAGLCPHLKVLALEQKESRVTHIQANQQKMGVANYHVLHGDALDFLRSFPKTNTPYPAHEALTQPDRIFIGGGGANIAQLIELSLHHLKPQGLLVVSAVSLESFHAIAQCAPEHRISLSSIQIAHEQSIAREYHHLKAQNTIYIFTFCQEKNHDNTH